MRKSKDIARMLIIKDQNEAEHVLNQTPISLAVLFSTLVSSRSLPAICFVHWDNRAYGPQAKQWSLWLLAPRTDLAGFPA